MLSRPTEQRTKPSVIPTSFLSVILSLLCVVEAGCVTIVLESPKFADREHIRIAFKNFLPSYQNKIVTILKAESK